LQPSRSVSHLPSATAAPPGSAMAPMKRPAAAPKVAPPKKAKKDPLAEKAELVTELAEKATGYPEAVLGMLMSSMETSLLVPKDARHEYQEEVVKMFAEVLHSVEEVATAAVAAAQGKAAAVEADKCAKDGVVEATKGIVKEKQEGVEAAKTAMQEAAVAKMAATTEHTSAAAEQKTGDAELDAVEGKKASLESTMAEEFQPLKDGTAGNVKKAVQAVIKALKAQGVEQQLLASADPALSRAAAERGSFDIVVIQQIEEHFMKLKASFQEQLDNGTAAKAERAAKVEKAIEEVAAADACLEARKTELTAAQHSLTDAKVTLVGAQTAAQELLPELEELAGEVEAACAELATCKVALEAFEELAERRSEPAPEAAAPEGEDAAVVAAQ